MATRRKNPKRLTVRERQSAEVRVRAVVAEEFRLVDGAGRTRTLLTLTRVGPRLEMMHEDGTVALEVLLSGSGPAVRFTDAAGKTRLYVGAMRGTPRIGMADGEGSPRLFAGLSHGGKPSVTLYDDSRRKVWTSPATNARASSPTPSARSGKSRAPAK